MADATTVLTIPILQSLHSRGHFSDSQLMSEYVSAGYPYAMTVQLLARYHNLQMSVRTFKNRLLYYSAFGIQRRLNPATPDTGRDCISQQLNLWLHHMLYSGSQRPSHPF